MRSCQTLTHDLRHLLTRAVLEAELGSIQEVGETLKQARLLCVDRPDAAPESEVDLTATLAEELRAAQHVTPGREVRTLLPAACQGTWDPTAIRRVVANLLGNALRATPVGGAIEVQLWRDIDGCRIRIEDSGQGMDAGDIDRLLSTRSTASSGSGTGTLSVAECAGRLRADIRVRTGAGLGTEIEVRLPG